GSVSEPAFSDTDPLGLETSDYDDTPSPRAGSLDTESPSRPTIMDSLLAEPAFTEPVVRTAKVRRQRNQDNNLIEFPRSQNLFENELAEPIAALPRILEAEPVVEEAATPAPQQLATITLDEGVTNWQRAYLEPYED